MSESNESLEAVGDEPSTDGTDGGPSGGGAPAASGPKPVSPVSAIDHPRPYRMLSVTVFALLGLLAMAGVKSYRELAAAQDVEASLRREISETQTRIRALTEHIDRIENDPATLERLAREELGMVREGDLVIVLPEEAESMEAAPTAARE